MVRSRIASSSHILIITDFGKCVGRALTGYVVGTLMVP